MALNSQALKQQSLQGQKLRSGNKSLAKVTTRRAAEGSPMAIKEEVGVGGST